MAFFSMVAGRGHRVCVAQSVRCVGVWHRFRRSSNGDRNRKRGRSGASDGKERKPRGLTKKKKSLSSQRSLICLSENVS